MLPNLLKRQNSNPALPQSSLCTLHILRPQNQHELPIKMHSRRISILNIQSMLTQNLSNLRNRLILRNQNSSNLRVLLRLRQIKIRTLQNLRNPLRTLSHHPNQTKLTRISNRQSIQPNLILIQMRHNFKKRTRPIIQENTHLRHRHHRHQPKNNTQTLFML